LEVVDDVHRQGRISLRCELEGGAMGYKSERLLQFRSGEAETAGVIDKNEQAVNKPVVAWR